MVAPLLKPSSQSFTGNRKRKVGRKAVREQAKKAKLEKKTTRSADWQPPAVPPTLTNPYLCPNIEKSLSASVCAKPMVFWSR